MICSNGVKETHPQERLVDEQAYYDDVGKAGVTTHSLTSWKIMQSYTESPLHPHKERPKAENTPT